MAKFSLHQEHLVREIFPPTIDYDITSMGSIGFNVTNFSALYPTKLNIFVPYDFATNRISSGIPADFESFFSSLDGYIEYLKRLVEEKVDSVFYGRGAEYAIGQMSFFDYNDSRRYTFALKPHGAKSGGLTLLCRYLVNNAGTPGVVDKAMSRIEIESKADYVGTALSLVSDKAVYVYWAMKPSKVFIDPEFVLSALMSTTPKKAP